MNAGALKVTTAFALPANAEPIVGASGVVYGVALEEAELAALFPAALVATTVKVYAVPLVKPFKVIGLDKPVAVYEPGLEVTVYPVIADPPLDAGALKATETCPFPAVGDPMVGAPGTVNGVTLFEAELAALVPTLLVAVTENV